MKFKAKKTYGQSKIIRCPFCERQATHKNEDGLDVCSQHIKEKLEEIKCTCGSWLEQRTSKFGPYFNCINCGNFNYAKAMEIKAITQVKTAQKVKVEPKKEVKEKKEITITSNDVEYFS